MHVRVDLSCLNVDCHIGLAQHNVRQGWRAWVFQHWLRSGRHCFVSLRCLLTRSVLWTLPMSTLGSCLLLRLLRLGLGLPSVLVTGLSCPLLVISLLPAFGGAGKLGSGITSGPAPVVLPLFRVVLAVLCWLALNWVGKDTNLPSEEIGKIRSWLSTCQLRIWDTKVPSTKDSDGAD